MMPVAKGAKRTRLQILIYSLVFAPVAVAPAFTGLGGPLYLAVSGAGRRWVPGAGRPRVAQPGGRRRGRGRATKAASYDVKAEAKPARNLFAFSILYLFALFAALLAEQLLTVAPLELIP